MSDYTKLKKILHKFSEDITNECIKVSEDISDSVESMIKKAESAKALPDKVNKKPKKKCPAGKIINPKTGRCINKPKEKTQKKRGRPKKSDKPVTQKPKKECPPGKIINPKTGRCINKPKEKTQKKRGRPKKSDKSPPVSKYYQKQYEKYVKPSEGDNIQEAFFEKVVEEPKKQPRYNLRGVNK
jgi:hypothetical protein